MKKNRFVNPHQGKLRRTIWDAMLWKMGYYNDPIKRALPPADFVYPAQAKPFDRRLPSVVWIGHSSFLIEIDGLFILTDPVWEPYCSPLPFPGLKRHQGPPIPLADLPPIDIVLISHNHYDHLDSKTVNILHRFHPQIQWVVPLALSPWFRLRKIDCVKELGWWKTLNLEKCSITAVPAQHFSGRTLWDQNQTFWNGYVLEKGSKKLYFTGDTGYNPYDFKEIGAHWSQIDLGLIPIGTYVPQKFMQPVHVSPEEAVQIHEEVGSQFSIGMHWKTFRLSDEPRDLPPYDLYLSMKKKGIPLEQFLPLDVGTYVNW